MVPTDSGSGILRQAFAMLACVTSQTYYFCGLYEKGHVVILLLLADLACLFMLRVQLGNFTFLQDSLRQSSLERHTSFARDLSLSP